ncbi:MAG: endoglucanase [Solirubrobacteraceae bacterium]|jgi:endoglucanase|nr:endoglucanase [Solirubrobacteraceae bacterium]
MARRVQTTALLAATMLVAVLAFAGPAGAQTNPLCGLPLFPQCPDPPDPPPPPPPPPPSQDPRGVDPASPNPLLGERWYIDKSKWSVQYNQYRHYRRQGEDGKAALVGKIALEPQFKWFGRWNEDDRFGTAGTIRAYLERAQEEMRGAVPQVIVMRAQAKQCHRSYSGGGPVEDARTRDWYRDFARGVGDSRIVIGFEPDSLGTLDCQARSRRKARLDLLRYGVDVLSQLPNATIYLEGGASDWEAAPRTAQQLRYIGIAKVRGFMLNVTHYDWTANNIRHGRAISRRTGGKPFIISTAFNGRGPVHYRRWISRKKHLWRRVTVWCHPQRRGLGTAPTTTTDDPKVDAYLYIGRPGFSGGSCNGGPLPVGSWFEERALMFGRNATNWIRPPRGTRFGWPRGTVSVRSLAGDQFKH